jgi:5-formyltetrahydrofolate cyclo-ligase
VLAAKEFLERNSEEKNWKTRINIDDIDTSDTLLSLLEVGGLSLEKQKEYVRSYFLTLRTRLTHTNIKEKSHMVCRNLEALECFRSSKRVGLYSPVRKEVDTGEVFSLCGRLGKEVYFPRVEGDGLSFRRVSDPALLRPGKFNVPEPDSRLPGIEPGSLDILLIPGVAFDSSGMRIGYGTGYYDRLLAEVPINKRIAMAYSVQISDSLPHGKGDRSMGLVVTELGIIFCRRIEGGEYND